MCKIFIKSSLDGMNEISTNSIDLIFTSPPYWDLKDYKNPNQLGLGLTFETYLTYLDQFLLSCCRVLKHDSYLVINIADIRTNISRGEKTRPKTYSIQAHIITKLESLGLDLNSHRIWKKTSVKKSNKKIIYGVADKNFVYPPLVYNDLDIEHILAFRKPGPLKKFGPREDRTNKLDKSNLTDEFSSIWKFNNVVQNKDHPAQFPLELTERVLKLFSISGDTILDPFIGSGTTALAALNLNRKFYGYELNSTFIDSSLKQYIIK